MPLRRLRAGVQPSYPTICRERRELGTASPAPPTAPGRCDAPRAPLTYPKLRRALCTTKLGAKPAAGPRHPRSRAPDALLPARRSHKSAQRSAAERGPRSWAEAAALLEQRSEATRKTKDCDATFKNPKKKKNPSSSFRSGRRPNRENSAQAQFWKETFCTQAGDRLQCPRSCCFSSGRDNAAPAT